METNNLNLCELLKGHEGETFYTTVFGDAEFTKIHDYFDDYPIIMNDGGFSLSGEGKYFDEGECVIFPSKDQRNWDKWIEEQKPKFLKTWEDIKICNAEILQAINHLDHGAVEPVVKSAIALLKIHELIEVGYGGNPIKEVWRRYTIQYQPNYSGKEEDQIYIECTSLFNHIAFYTEEQAKEFLSYPENVQLVKDFYMA